MSITAGNTYEEQTNWGKLFTEDMLTYTFDRSSRASTKLTRQKSQRKNDTDQNKLQHRVSKLPRAY